MPGFEDLGLNEVVIANAREQGFDAPSALQRSVIPVIRRGGNAIIRASSGSGMTAAFAMALIDRLTEGGGTRALVIVPTGDRAERVAGTIARFAQGTNVRVAALTSSWSNTSTATILVASAEKLMSALEESRIRFDPLEIVVVDGAAAIQKLAGAQAIETLLASLPKEGQRVFISSELGDDVRKLAESHARKALYFPPRPAVEEIVEKTPAGVTVRYAVATGGRKADIVARIANSTSGAITLICRSAATARNAERELGARGFESYAATYDGFDRAEAKGTVFGYDAPFSADQLTECFRSNDVILVERSELPHLKSIAADANVRLESASMPAYEADSLNAFRNDIRRAAREEDLEAQMLVLEPLFSELSPEEVAAAAAALLRARRPAKAEREAGARPGVKTWARLFMSIGERDGVRPQDLVGAITGESGVRGEDVGRVDIRDTFSVIEVAVTAADKIIRAMNGTTMKGRALRVDYDRKTAPERSGPRGAGRAGGGREGGGGRREGGGGGREGGGGRREGGGGRDRGDRPGSGGGKRSGGPGGNRRAAR